MLKGLTPDAAKALDASAENGTQKPLRYEALAMPRAARLTIETFALPPANEGARLNLFLAATFQQIRDSALRIWSLISAMMKATIWACLCFLITDRPFLFNDSAEAVSRTFPSLHLYSISDQTSRKNSNSTSFQRATDASNLRAMSSWRLRSSNRKRSPTRPGCGC